MNVEELFRRPNAPSNKRKLEPAADPTSLYKSAKLSQNGDAKGKRHAVIAEEEQEDEDMEAGPELPPDAENEGPDDDEEGRFFGSGVTSNTADVLDYIEDQDGEEVAPEIIDASYVRRLAQNFDKRIKKNAELRAKFEEQPQKFMESEGELDAEIKTLSILTNYPTLYTEFVKLEGVEKLVGLLAHENTDIAIGAIEILAELTDEDVQAEQTQWDTVVEAMLEADLPSLLVQNLNRLDERDESDRSGVYHSLSLVENLSSQIEAAEKLVAGSSLMAWLLERIQKKEAPTTQNKQFAAETLEILVQSSPNNLEKAIQMDAVDLFLQVLSAYRKRDPEKDSEEEEFAENLFDCLTCMVDGVDGKKKFVEAEGVELCLIMLREGKFSKPRALRVLDHGMGGQYGAEVCEKVVEAAGLKTIFSLFMKRVDKSDVEHLIGIFASMLRLLPGDSAPRIRTLAKFFERAYEKIEKLVKLRREYQSRLSPVEDDIVKQRKSANAEDLELLEDEWLSIRLDAGLFSFQTIDVVLAWLAAEDDGAKKKIQALLADQDQNLTDMKSTLQEQLQGLQRSSEEAIINEAEMLRTLLEYLQ